ncbi:MAG TPA: DNA translocase FtsK 4TM domain-containing protein, partial [Holophagaceae bacterium]|nr:DNA translocase FtsK 4TM domain-containing protein [Holophagaceae bacterium]
MAGKPMGGGEQSGAGWGPALRLVFRLLGGALAILLLLSLASYHPTDPQPFASGTVGETIHNWCGTAGAFLAGALQTFAGWGALLVPFYLAWECWPHEGMGPLRRGLARASWLAGSVSVWVLLGALPAYHWTVQEGTIVELRWGGWMGTLLWPKLRHVFGPVGLPLLLVAFILVSAFIIEPVLTAALGRLVVRFFGEKAWPFLKPMPGKGVRGFLTMARRPFLRQDGPEDLSVDDLIAMQDQERREAEMEAQRESLIRAEMEAADLRKRGAVPSQDSLLPAIHSLNLPEDPGGRTLPPIQSMQVEGGFHSKLLQQAPPPKPPKPTVEKPQVMRDRFGREMVQQPLPLSEPTPNRPLPTLPEGRLPAKPVPERPAPGDTDALPPRRLFDPPQPHGRVDAAALEDIKARIGAKLAEFKIKGAVTGVQPGPVVTVFEFQPDAGIPLSRILGMEEDLALALQAEAVRMDRIPGKNLVGIEVPNARREIIAFREVLDSPAFLDAQGLLNLALGKDMAGHPVVADLTKMPHLLIGGSTGSGKSVGVNAMISSVLLRAKPDEAKLILIDPKMVEMGVYEDIPHLWAPVVTDMKEAGRVLKWVVAQMEDRYRRLTLVSARDIESFNRKVREAGGRIDLSARTPNPKWPDRPKELDALPFVVVVIDELADLMMVARSEVEESIARIAQKARAV